MSHCPTCNSQRPESICWKCGSPTFEPAADWTYPELPDVSRIREIALGLGYAIGEHGSKERDLDLIATPWTEAAVDSMLFLEDLSEQLNARIVSFEAKPFGRCAAIIQLNGWFKPIDISVCPRVIHGPMHFTEDVIWRKLDRVLNSMSDACILAGHTLELNHSWAFTSQAIVGGISDLLDLDTKSRNIPGRLL